MNDSRQPHALQKAVNRLSRLASASGPRSAALIRLAVGAVFLSERLQKFLDPAARGAGRFAKIGLPEPTLLGLFVGSFEVVCGALVLVGALTRLAALPLMTIMLVALAATKWPILHDRGFWDAAHEARTDWAMLLGSLFLMIAGSGPWSLDRLMFDRRGTRSDCRARPPAAEPPPLISKIDTICRNAAGAACTRKRAGFRIGEPAASVASLLICSILPPLCG